MDKALKKIRKELKEAAEKQPKTRLPVIKPTRKEVEAAVVNEPASPQRERTVASVWSDDIDLLINMHNIPESNAHKLWNMVPQESRRENADEYMESLIDAYVKRRDELGEEADDEEDVYDPGLERGQRKFGNIIIETRPAVREVHLAAGEKAPQVQRQTVFLTDEALERELHRRLKRAYSHIKSPSIVRPQRELSAPGSSAAVHALGVAKQCIGVYDRYPWVTDYDYTLIGFPGKERLEYVHRDMEPVYVKGVRMYHPNSLFNLINCNKYRHERSQKGNILTAYTVDHKKRKFIVAHIRTNGEAIVQDESVFADEVRWIRQSMLGRTAKFEQLLSTSLGSGSDAVVYARRVVAARLASLIDSSASDEYSRAIESGMYDTLDDGFSVRDYLRVAAATLVFLDPMYFGPYAHVFAKRVRERMYVPREIAELDDSDKFPEAFMNLSISTQNAAFVRDKLESAKGEIVDMLGRQIYAVANPTERIQWASKTSSRIQVAIPDSTIKCVGADSLDEWEIVRYTDDGVDYCFSISELLAQFESGNYTNPYTKKVLDQSFVDRVVSTFQTPIVHVPVLPSEVDVAPDEVASAPDLVALLESELKSLEQRLELLPPDRRPRVCAYCTTYILPQSGVSSLDYDAQVVDFCNSECLAKSSV